jgi:hypothetical protein
MVLLYSDEYEFSGQLRQVSNDIAANAFEYFPAMHGKQVMSLVSVLYVPGVHSLQIHVCVGFS